MHGLTVPDKSAIHIDLEPIITFDVGATVTPQEPFDANRTEHDTEPLETRHEPRIVFGFFSFETAIQSRDDVAWRSRELSRQRLLDVWRLGRVRKCVMPFSPRMAHVANRFFNPVMGIVAGRVPPLALVVHRGRRSGTSYRNPVIAHPNGDQVVFALTYGSTVNWVRNTLAAGTCDLISAGQSIELAGPVIETHSTPPAEFGRLQRRILTRAGVVEYLRMQRTDRPSAGLAPVD